MSTLEHSEVQANLEVQGAGAHGEILDCSRERMELGVKGVSLGTAPGWRKALRQCASDTCEMELGLEGGGDPQMMRLIFRVLAGTEH